MKKESNDKPPAPPSPPPLRSFPPKKKSIWEKIKDGFNRDTENLSSYNPCGGYQPRTISEYARMYSPKAPPKSRGLPEVNTNTPMPQIKPPKHIEIVMPINDPIGATYTFGDVTFVKTEDGFVQKSRSKDMNDFYNEQILRYERVYSEAIKVGATPEDAKKHADNVIMQTINLYIYHSMDIHDESVS